MYPRETTYRLAGPQDYPKAHAFLRAQGADDGRLSWPTVLAWRGEEIIGVLSRVAHKKAVIAGPLVVAGARPLMTIIRLVEAWERVMWRLGTTEYFFGVDLTTGKAWLRLLDKAGLVPYTQADGAAWFKRTINVR